jgi:hypothetical protein
MKRATTTARVFAVLALSASALSGAPGDTGIERDLTEILKDSRYAFCHEPRPLPYDIHGACAYAKAARESCPAFERACQNAKPPPSRDSSPLRVPLWVTGVARVLFWLLLGGAVIWLLRQIIPQLRRGAASESEPEREKIPRTGPEEAAPVAPRPLLETDAGRLFAAARAAAGTGDLAAAVRLAHAATVRALEQGGYVRVERTSTSGDYLRALGTEPELRDVYGGVARELERVEFGALSPNPEKIGGLLARIEPLVRRAGMTIAMVVSLAALGCESPGMRGDLNDDSPLGASVLRRLLERHGAVVERRVDDVAELMGDADVILVLDTRYFVTDDWNELDSFADEGGTVVLSGVRGDVPAKWGILGTEPDFCPGPIHVVDLENGTTASSPRPAHIAARAPALRLDPSFEAAVACARGPLVARAHKGKGAIVVISDPDFISNASMAAGDPARVLLPLLGSPKRVAVIDRFSRAEGAKDPYRAVAHSGLAPALSHALAWLVLLAFALGKSFGTPRDPVDPPRRAFSDHVRAVGRLYELAGASRHALGLYAGWALEQLNTRLRPGGTQRMLDLSNAVAQRTRRPEGKIAAILANASDARDRPDGPNAPLEDLDTMKSLNAFLNEIGGRR